MRSDRAQTAMTLVVENGRVLAVEKGYATPTGAQDKVIDLKNRTVLPGLIDCHVHLEGETSKEEYLREFTQNPADVAFGSLDHARKTLLAGFTTVRDLGGSGVNVALRNAINQGKVVGPRIFTARKAISGTGGHMDPTNGYRLDLMGMPGPADGVINSPDEARQAVREQYKRGADLIKIASTGGVLSVAKDGSAAQMTEAEIRAVVETARDLGLAVACHAHGAEGMKRAIRAGVTSIEHGTLMDDETMKLMVKNGTWYVPTITAGKSVADSAKIPNYYPALVTPKALAIGPKLQGTFGRAYKAGVKIAFGTDAAVFRHGVNALEFRYMVEAGMPTAGGPALGHRVGGRAAGPDRQPGHAGARQAGRRGGRGGRPGTGHQRHAAGTLRDEAGRGVPAGLGTVFVKAISSSISRKQFYPLSHVESLYSCAGRWPSPRRYGPGPGPDRIEFGAPPGSPTAPTPCAARLPRLLQRYYGPAPMRLRIILSSLSLELGWGAPYGFGVTYAAPSLAQLDVNGGLGMWRRRQNWGRSPLLPSPRKP